MSNPIMTTLSLGGGVQSSTLAEMIVEGDLPPVNYVIFADTGDEPDYVYQQVEYLRGRLASVGVPLEVVTAGDMLDDFYTGSQSNFLPVYSLNEQQSGARATTIEIGKFRRQCTSGYKIKPIRDFVASKIGSAAHFETWLGISLDEVQRVKRSRNKWEITRWPLIEKRMSRADCIHYLQSKNLPVPRKSSCRICPFHNDAHWQDMRDSRPNDWAHVVKFDDDLRNGKLKITTAAKGELFLHRSCVPLSEVTFANEGQLAFDFCGGECFT